MAQRDPFSWAADFANTQHQRAAQEQSMGQDALMNVFVAEARRQQPWADLPVDLAKQRNQYDLSMRNNRAMFDYRASAQDATQRRKWANAAPAEVTRLVSGTAKAYGLDSDLMMTIADIETGGRFNPDAKNPMSSAYGLFQQTDDNWNSYGGGSNRANPAAQTQAAALFMRDILNTFSKNGIEPTAGNVYLAWQQGPAGAVKLLRNPNAPAEQVVGIAEVRQNGGRPGMSAGQFANMWRSKADRIYQQRVAARQKAGPQIYTFGGKEFSLDEPDVVASADTSEDEMVEPGDL